MNTSSLFSVPRVSIAAAIGALLLGAALFAPLPSRADIISVIVAVVTAGAGVAVYDYNSCDINLIWGCGGGGGGGGGGNPNITNPPPAPTITEDNFYADPSLVENGETTTLYWDIDDADICRVTGGSMAEFVGTGEGQVESSPIEGTTFFTLECYAEGGPSAQLTIRVMPIPVYREI